MTIETKYNIGDTVYLIRNSEITKGEIINIRTDIFKSVSDFKYGIYCDGEYIFNIKENLLFPSKKELIKSL